MNYGILTNSGIIAYSTQVPGSKPMEESNPACPDGYRATYEWVDVGDKFVQVYNYVPLTDEEKEEIERHKQENIEIPDSDALKILLGGEE